MASYAELERLTDDELMAILKAGHHDALAVLFDWYHRLVYSIALKIVRDPAEAEDVMQNVFLDIFRAVAQFDPLRGTTKTWILQYAYHRAINRKQYLNARDFYDQEGSESVEGAAQPHGFALGKLTHTEARHLLQRGLATLKTAQRQVIEMATYEGFSMKEIADRTGESLVNVRHHYYRGLEKLRSMVDQPAAGRKAVGE